MGTFLYLATLIVAFHTVDSYGVRHRVIANRDNLGSKHVHVAEEQYLYDREDRQAHVSWMEWTVYKGCSVTCGAGVVQLTRNCSTGNNADCSHVGGTWWSVVKCDAGSCDASWSEWSTITQCSASCGQSGYKEQVRNCSTGQLSDCENIGGRYWKVISCNNGPCVPMWMEWGPTSTCSVSCGTGVSVRYRNCSTGFANECRTGKAYELKACSIQFSCSGSTPAPTTVATTTPVVGTWSEWSVFKACSVTCGDGFGERLRNCSTGNSNDCPGLYWEVSRCNLRECIINGEWADWGTWSTCSVSCGAGSAIRSRACTYADPANKGDPCSGLAVQNKDCNEGLCPVDGTWGDWGSWSTCSQSCDEGQQTRTRACNYPNNTPQGADCVGSATDTQICKEAVCEGDGVWTTWSTWSKCTSTCGSGVKFKARTCVFDESRPHGKECNGSTIDRAICSEYKACAVDGSWTEWSSWSQCTTTCGGGFRSRTRVCGYDPLAPHGAACPGEKRDIGPCADTECPVDGQWGGWAAWQACSVSCGGGTQVKTRTCLYRGPTPTTPRGQPCDGDDHLQQDCNTAKCAVDGRWSEWSNFGPCNATCGGGFQMKARLCQFPDNTPHGKDCDGNANFWQQCNAQLCPVDGQLTDWGQWSPCTASCDGGTRQRTRQCSFPLNVPHGADCTGSLTDIGPCSESPCPTTTTTTTEAPVPGHWSDWSVWTDCTLTCGSGTHTRNRSCLYPDHSLHGEKCPGDTTQTADCNTQHCPVDGVWSSWSVYSRCSSSCGNGTHSRRRTCDFDPKYDRGENCTGSSTQSGYCWAGYCPVDGVWNDWTAWQTCSVTCGGGTQQRSRVCYHQANRPIGENCTGPAIENQSCGDNLCPVDGKLSPWSDWSTCPVTCGGSLQVRNRTCGFQSGYPKGNDCLGDRDQNKTCNDNLCPVDGIWSSWSLWSTCSKTCGSGTSSRNRICNFDNTAPHGEDCVGLNTEDKQCNTNKCPVDGHWTDWANWSTCSVSCENGTRSRDRICAFIDGVPHGLNCTGDSTEAEPCNEGRCPVDGVWSDWATWVACSVSCGTGSKSRSRTCDFPNDSTIPHGNDCTGSAVDTAVCNTNLCPIDGQFGSWAAWGGCSLTCGGGTQSRSRNCLFDPVAPHGQDCPGSLNETQSCNDDLCPVDGVWSEWSNYTVCSTTCGGGTRVRKRKCEYRPEAAPQGEKCKGTDSETDPCSPDLCPVDGKLSEWSAWTTCSLSCANGTQSRNRSCDFDAVAPHGNDCVGDLSATQSCNVERCPVNGLWSEWSNYTDCTVTCAGGSQTRNRTCVFDPDAPHGAACYGNVTNVRDCNTQPCPVDGVWGDWNAWHACDVTCGGGNRVRDRDCTYPADTPHGNDCTAGTNHDIEPCNDNACPVDGLWSDWSAWTKCSKTCGGGTQFHTRKCKFVDGVPHGENCNGTDNEQGTCGDSLCPVDGVWSDWAAWSTCSVSCGGGQKSRLRNCTYNINPDNPEPQGDPCPGNDTDVTACGTDACPVDGVWSQWSDFSPCTKSCGNGTSTRTRDCTFSPPGSPHGTDCVGLSMDVKSCNETECPQDAVWQAWSKWTTCTTTCGGGNQTRDRICTWPSSVHGDNCTGDSQETQGCNNNLCPVDGVWTAWTDWSTCSETCDVGHSYRTRNCTYDPVAPKGAVCPGKPDDSKFCELEKCKVDGIWSDWSAWGSCSVTCGAGNETRSRRCEFVPADHPHGLDCVGDTLEYKPCDNFTDCPVDGYWGSWESWSVCSTSCGTGDKYRTRQCEFDPTKPRGNDCPHGKTNDTDTCNLGPCPVDGNWLAWSNWASCSVTCGGGSQERTRTCFYQPGVPHGTPCPGSAAENQTCNTNKCEVDGVFADWSQWSSCSTTCGSGTQDRSRTCTFDPPDAPKGKNCTGNWAETKTCTPAVCPVDGTWATWNGWSACTVSCGGGTQGRTRDCTFPSHVPQGDPCPGQGTEQRTCGNNTCPVDGVWATWNGWTSCTVTCGGGTKTRTRDCYFPPRVPQGDPCPGAGNEQTTCSNNTCPVDGHFTDWSVWTDCSVTCGDGEQTRNRSCEFNPPEAPRGDDCIGNITDIKACHKPACKVDGVWATWNGWTSCTVTCGGGTKTRTRDCYFPPHVPQGDPCPGVGNEATTCSNNTCPRHCQVCTGSPVVCETDYELQECPIDKQYCINTVDNFDDATRDVERKCGTREECRNGWFETYSSDDKCTNFDQDYIYANTFYCEYCCDTDGCNSDLYMANTWSP